MRTMLTASYFAKRIANAKTYEEVTVSTEAYADFVVARLSMAVESAVENAKQFKLFNCMFKPIKLMVDSI